MNNWENIFQSSILTVVNFDIFIVNIAGDSLRIPGPSQDICNLIECATV